MHTIPQEMYDFLQNIYVSCHPHAAQSTHRMATLASWRTFSHDGKIYPG
jgi:hypothetical protein